MTGPSDPHTLQALGEAVDAARAEAETTWGAERLPLLVDDAMRAKVHSQTAKWSRAFQVAWAAVDAGRNCTRDELQAVEDAAAAMKRMWPKLGELASEAGHRPLSVNVWEVPLADGSIMALVRTNDEAAQVLADGRYLVVVTPAEIAATWDALPAALQLAKVTFPGAKIGAVDRSWVRNGDEIPFPASEAA